VSVDFLGNWCGGGDSQLVQSGCGFAVASVAEG
jgi:hypothetical protein